MGQQLALIERSELEWRIDDQTREVGRRGLAEAREALRSRTHDESTPLRPGRPGHPARPRRPPSRPRAA